jgi:hypothetical protein
VQRIAINLQTNLVTITVDSARPFSPSRVWKEIQRIGFTPDKLEVWAEGEAEEHAFVVDGVPWPLESHSPQERRKAKGHFSIVDGSKDPPTVVPLVP